MSQDQTPVQYAATLSLEDRVLHVLGPFSSLAEAADEAKKVLAAVNMFRRIGEPEASYWTYEMVPNLDSLLARMRKGESSCWIL